MGKIYFGSHETVIRMLWEILIISVILQVPPTVKGCTSSCTCHQDSIDCSSRLLTSVPHDLSPELHIGPQEGSLLPDTTTTVTTLNLANNQLQELPTSLISERLPHLRTLDLSNNKIQDIYKIQSVVLSKELLYLKLGSNPIKNLGFNSDNVLYSQSVFHLDISDCNINSITNPVTFMYMLNLTHLDLSGNPLVVIDHLFSTTLSHLDLSRCLLGLNDKGIREETFTSLPKLEFLNLTMNAHLTTFSFSKPLSSSLLHLESSYCALEKLDLRSFPNLQHAILKGNVIKILYNNMLSNNENLQNLDISENSIHRIELNAFMGGKSLRNLDLSLNLLSELNWSSFHHTPQLGYLNISRNLFVFLDEIPIPSLLSLDASKCDIIKLSPRFLAKTQDIRFLNLSHNSIEKLPRRLTSRTLLSLDLSFCRIFDIPDETFQELPSLVNLDLTGNRLTTLKNSLLDHLVNIRELNLLNNPWHCDCTDLEFQKLWKYLSSYPAKSKHLKLLMCHSPKEHAGISWEKSCFASLTSDGKTPKTKAWMSFLVPFLTLCCLLAVLVVIRQAYISHALEVQHRENVNQRQRNSPSGAFPPRVPVHFFDEDLERGIQLSVNESTQRSPIRELSKLPSYEEALLLPKLQDREDLQKIAKKYEDSDRFERSANEDSQSPILGSNQVEEATNHPSTSSQ
ncbi:leucine-rich repeat-containing G-protein coupled receptor 6-like isoform X2 [Homalodisca vitripennis]|uniref:leucine-rich repeat-containing G-protein coupled receptor 6-like isoform X2 n=1 Tax=Homalodisca vitripennis TaxID=197043 RepID=UPI001EECC6DB|nr:leucine-rich repeat-containing G-protein coupled receptor 6-like isoform X2 [Homalodisca vitripennis]